MTSLYDENCGMYTNDNFILGLFLAQIVAITIVVINIILKSIMLALILYIGYHTESEQTGAIKSSVFVT